MTTADVRLLSPEIALVGVGLLIIALDLFVKRKGLLGLLSALGLLVPLALSIWLWMDVAVEPDKELVGIFGTLVVDRFALFFKFLVLGVAAVVVLGSSDYARHMKENQGEYYGLVLFSATGMMLLAATEELIAIYVALELTTLPLIALAAFLKTSRSSESGLKFLVLSAVSSALLLYGIALVYGFTGSTFLADIARQVASLTDPGVIFGGSSALLLGVVLIIAGFGFKISAAPFHMWVPDVYEGAPTPITAYLSVASKAAGFAVLLRVLYAGFEVYQLDWQVILAAMAAISMTIGNLVAIAQTSIKRLLAYSTIAHAGYLLVGLAAIAPTTADGDTSGPSSVLYYLGAYAATNLAAFFAVMAISNKVGSDQISDFAGISRRAPVLALALSLSLVALIGVPPTGIFIAKLYVFGSALESGLFWLVAVGVANTVLSAYYYLRVVRTMYLEPPTSEESVPMSLSLKLALGASTLGVLAFGLLPGPLLRLAELSTETLLTSAVGYVGLLPIG